MSGVYEGLTVVELADRRNQWAGKLLSDWRRPRDPDRAHRRQPRPLVRPVRRRQGRSRPLPGLLVEQHGQRERRPRPRAQACPGSRAEAPGPRRHFPREHAARHAREARPGLRRRRRQPIPHLRLAHRLRPGRAVARLPDERRRASRARRPDVEHGLLGSRRSRRSADRATRRGTWAARSSCTASPWRSSTA